MRIVENGECVEWAVSEAGANFTHFALCGVEEHGWRADTTPKGVKAAAAEFFSGVRCVFLFAEGDLGPESGWLPGFDRGAADGADEIATGGEGLVANHPGRKTKTRATGEEAVVGIAFELER